MIITELTIIFSSILGSMTLISSDERNVYNKKLAMQRIKSSIKFIGITSIACNKRSSWNDIDTRTTEYATLSPVNIRFSKMWQLTFQRFF